MKIYIILALFNIAIFFTSPLYGQSQAIIEVDLNILDDIAKQIQANVESIRSWQGEVNLEEKTFVNNGIGQIPEIDYKKIVPIDKVSLIKFWVDIPQRKRMFISEPINEKRIRVDGVAEPVVYEKQATLILHDVPVMYRRTALDPKGTIPLPGSESGTTVYVDGKKTKEYDIGVLKGNIHISSNTEVLFSTFDYYNNFDPFRILDHMDTSYVALLNNLRRLAQEDRSKIDIIATRNGDYITVTHKVKMGSQELINSYTFDYSKRCCPIKRYCFVPNKIDTTLTTEYQDCNGIFIPENNGL